MSDRDAILEEIRHVRTAHIVLVVAIATVSYVVMAAWTDAPEVRRESEALERDMRGFATDPRLFLTVAPHSVPAYADLIPQPPTDDSFGDRELPGGVIQAAERVVRFDGLPNPETSSLAELERGLEKASADYQRITAFELPQAAVDWIRASRSSRSVPVDGGEISFVGHGPRVTRLDVAKWPKNDAERGLARVRLRMVETTWNPPVQGPDGMFHGAGGKSESYSDRDFEVAFRVSAKEAARLSPGWFARHYPHLASSGIRTMSVGEIRAAAGAAAEKKLRERSARFADLEIQGQDIAYAAPAVIITLLVYLLACLGQIVGALRRQGAVLPLIPFVCGAPGRMSRIIAWLTMAVLPACSVGLVLWRVKGSPGLGWSWGLAAAAIGAFACRAAGLLPSFVAPGIAAAPIADAE